VTLYANTVFLRAKIDSPIVASYRPLLSGEGRLFSKSLLLACALVLCGCAARPVISISMSQPGDDALTCDQLSAQIAANDASEASYRKQDKDVENGNIAKGIGSAAPFVGPIIAASTDLSNEEQVKARSLADRNEQLKFLAKQKGCTK